ncbi:MAG: hypothetical protein KatS3mg112_1210 [Thermogutta sp.]|nr:MAG: hypothetical protein KatS3mg112_1210 [Thermogutta sp.]
MTIGEPSLVDAWQQWGTTESSGFVEIWPMGSSVTPADSKCLGFLTKSFGTDFAVFKGETGELLAKPEEPSIDWEQFGILCRVVATRGQPEIIWEEPPLTALAVPFLAGDEWHVAAAVFMTASLPPQDSLKLQAERLGTNAASLHRWAARQRVWDPQILLQVAQACREHFLTLHRIKDLESQADEMSMHLAGVYEEISLLHRLTRNLRLSKTDEELAKIAIDWLMEVVPAQGIGLVLLPVDSTDENYIGKVRTQNVLLKAGDLPLTDEQFCSLMEHWNVRKAIDPLVRNFSDPFTFEGFTIRNVIAVPVTEGENLLGYLAAFNHRQGHQFGSMEANLLHSVATIIGVHSANLELYRQQSMLLAGVIRALTSAIDAKDPYTCGHSDRVARIAVRLAQEMGYPPEMLSRVYLAGLLHDIGKIGVNDAVLQKPGKLTDEEFDHIKTHVEKGHRILSGLKQLDDILPAVLHHHESWDGTGYPHKLAGEAIPPIARIVAVADAYDAMASNRPYRSRMPNDKIDEIIRKGAGRQWDPRVVEAFFRARDDLRQIADEKDLKLINHPLLGPIVRKSLGMTDNGKASQDGSNHQSAADRSQAAKS